MMKKEVVIINEYFFILNEKEFLKKIKKYDMFINLVYKCFLFCKYYII